ncbi:hypothetical protein [Succinimonas amylolytica]|uniref:hypothetical protein n=1 Tax=Succinimonas amylolytica TaxID=83769 RepID=UPI00036DE4C1|nr:hypothetical protein [Succinimonas amylolytica]
MIFAVIVFVIIILVFVIIAYMIYSDYQVQQEMDKKLIISRQKNIIDESDDILMNVTHIPFSNRMIIILQNRILNALQIIASVQTNMQVQQRINDMTTQIEISKNSPSRDSLFMPPENADQSLKMIRIMRRLRKIIRIEFNRGRISKNDFVDEDKILEINIYKIQFSNLIKNIDEAHMNSQTGTERELIRGGLNSLNKLQFHDAWLESVKAHLQETLDNLNAEAEKKHEQEIANEKAKESDIDVLFMPKKKW